MILYVNGDSHSAGAEAVNPYCFAIDDPLYWGLGRRPHPDNERVSYGCQLANKLGAVLHCDEIVYFSYSKILNLQVVNLVGIDDLGEVFLAIP